ncbi:hypothetical protein [Rhizobium leguminosarum]|uniref:hypothetical protein n=1 Tax=Rhizobium leguminosarum TaxID=384 RepID=UPI001C96B48A|nr:hypothetical protein [Rhizobium leguminosarum]MBY5808553.1 hypothetical protein [Rhizobium leguminosarum]
MRDPTRIGALLASAVLFGLFVYLIIVGAGVGQYLAVGALLVFAVIATRIDDITTVKFSATGVHAALEKKLREAEATITQLQRIAELFGQISVLQISMSNRWDGLSSKEKREAISKIEKELRAINLKDDRIAEVLSPQRGYDRLDYYYWVTQAIPTNPTQNQLEGFTNFPHAFLDVSYYAVPPISAVEIYLTQNDIVTGEAIERLKDWKQYESEFRHRRIDLWDNRHALPK